MLRKGAKSLSPCALSTPSLIAMKRTSNNVYQIFTYVKNQDKDNTGDIAGILLYAKTDEDITPDVMFNIGSNQIGAKTLDLNKDFALIAAQLDKIAENYFGIKAD